MFKEKLGRALPAALAALLMASSLMTSARASVAFTPTNQYAGGRAGTMMSCPDACAGWIAAGAAVVSAAAAVVSAAAATAGAAAAESVVIIVVLADRHRGHSLTAAQRTQMASTLDH
jgi:hypothetical protein